VIQDLEFLIKLQNIDLRIKEQELAKEQYPAAVLDLQAQIKSAEGARDAAAARLEQLTGSISEFDDNTAKLRESLSKSQDRLNSIQTNREYDAVHKEIEAQKAMLGTSESRKTSLESDIERQKAALEESEKELERVKTELEPQIADLTAKIGAIDSTIAEITKERDEVSPQVSLHTQRTYDSIRKKRKNGKAISLVDANARTCSTCFMVLQPQIYNVVKRASKVVICESCGSMLIWDEASA